MSQKQLQNYHKAMNLSQLISNDSKCTLAQIKELLNNDQEFQTYLSSLDNWDHMGWLDNPLSAAIMNGRSDILGLLLGDYGLQVDARYHIEKTYSFDALGLAVAFNRQECAKVLIQQGADVDQGGIWCEVPFKNALHLDQLSRDGRLLFNNVKDRDDRIKKILEEEEEAKRKTKEAKG